ncbi:hypothetical protein [Streptomyces genisteinicus]|uniref:ATP/GTP-binding protein n=1 Tax=Streptomyces genisteinicus TaxID=2768068 RepID=A0A7H0I5A7_9ACTN|nr:hypothetical protein [Streptomyces genisteinicus]QNP67973.1 hypothetical protein IAG43_33960 [Streptomyces genisteinicus]
MIRLPTTHAAITAPLVASSTQFPGVPIGRSLLDGRAFHLSPVLAPAAILPSTNTLALGGLGSGKSTTAKARALREVRHHDHQFVVIDSFGEDGATGEWRPVAQALGGCVVRAGDFRLNPCSPLFSAPVREQLVRSLILAVEPDALTTQATHALQHALSHPKATALTGLVDALVSPQDGRWPAARLAEWGEAAAMALSRYTEGSLSGLFDGEDAGLPPTDLPIVSFDFTTLDRNSPAIPSLMAAVSCWAEHVWLPQSTATHRHLVLEEAWQILLSPATASLIQRQLKNSRKAALSLDVVMHTLSDLGDGRAQDLARLCEIAHIGRLGPEEATAVGTLLGLPQWAVDAIPGLGPGQAVWKVGPGYVDIVQTVLTEEEAELTDTSARRRAAQQILARDEEPEVLEADADQEDTDVAASEERLCEEPTDAEPDLLDELLAPHPTDTDANVRDGWDWDLPPNVVDHDTAATPVFAAAPEDDLRHDLALRAAHEGRHSEAAQIAAIGEREDINRHGISSTEAARWLVTRAQMADLSGDRHQAATLRATVTRMGKNLDWFEQPNRDPEQAWYQGADVPPTPEPADEPPSRRRRRWPYAATATAAALSLAIVGVGQMSESDQQQDRKAKADSYKGRSGAEVRLDGVNADVLARWNRERDQVIIELRTYFEKDARYLRLDADGQTASSEKPAEWFAESPELSLPVEDPLADVTVRVAIGGRKWVKGVKAPSRMIRLSPTGVAYDAETGERLPSDL